MDLRHFQEHGWVRVPAAHLGAQPRFLLDKGFVQPYW